jgi:hypothetical protein
VLERLAGGCFDSTALLATPFAVGFPAAGRSAARLRFNACIKLMTFWEDPGAGALIVSGNSACLLRSMRSRSVLVGDGVLAGFDPSGRF